MAAPTPTPDLSDRDSRLRAVLLVAFDVLVARQDKMLTIEEWAAMARAVTACKGGTAADYLSNRDAETTPMDVFGKASPRPPDAM